MEVSINNQQAQTESSRQAITPEIAIQMLKEGNVRFMEKRMLERDLQGQVSQTASGQYPFAAILGCIDSRVPGEVVFDQGIGDLFNVRIAGNFLNTDILGSLEFSCKVAGARVILVLGHTACGAIKGACDDVQLGNLTSMLSKLKPAVEAVTDEQSDRSSANITFVNKVSEMNVRQTIQAIRDRSEILKEMEDNGGIIIAGAMYDTGSGAVRFL